MPFLVGALILLAYFEVRPCLRSRTLLITIQCFNGNSPGAFRHAHTAGHHFHELCFGSPGRDDNMTPIESSLRDLDIVLRTALPLPGMTTFNFLPTAVSISGIASDTSQKLLQIAADDEELHHLIWNSAGPYLNKVSKTKILNFHNRLTKWKNQHSQIFSRFDNDECLRPEKITYRRLDKYTFPPQPHSDITEERACLTLALYTFYNMRLMWAVSLLEDRGNSELSAYFLLYQHLRFAATFLEISTSSQNSQRLLCENIKTSFAAMLHVAGHCCQNPVWMRWIARTLKQIGRHGLFDGNAFATNLDVLLTLKKPMVSELFPRPGGEGFFACYGGPDDSIGEHCVLGVAMWSNNSRNPDINLDLIPATHAQQFDTEWLSNQSIVKEWMAWAQDSE
ncbi:hypothetical protein BDV06DRAFT_144197 [Aspergillus oleicola]